MARRRRAWRRSRYERSTDYAGGWGGFAPYVPVGVRRAQAKRKLQDLRKAGQEVSPVEISGRRIATTFWGTAWCENLERYSDYSNRLQGMWPDARQAAAERMRLYRQQRRGR